MTDSPEQAVPATSALFNELVRLPLQVASELAARRDNRLNLHADMPCMLALMFTVENLAEQARDHRGDVPIPEEQLNDAANASCLMVLQRAGLEGEALGACLGALHAALDQMVRHGVLGPQAAHCHDAWPLMLGGDTTAAARAVQRAVHESVHAIDEWEQLQASTVQ